MASAAAFFRMSGAAKSGYPWDRLIASCSMARRVISRITDSVKSAALDEIGFLNISIIYGLGLDKPDPDGKGHLPRGSGQALRESSRVRRGLSSAPGAYKSRVPDQFLFEAVRKYCDADGHFRAPARDTA